MHDGYLGLSNFLRQGQIEGLHALFSDPEPEKIAALYRNGYWRACREALQSRFPSLLSVMGEADFRTACHDFVQVAPPQHRTLTAYGADFPNWLARYGPARLNPGWIDIAHLDGAWLDCLYGPDENPVSALQLNQRIQDGGGLPGSLRLPRNARLVSINRAVYDTWVSLRRQSEATQVPAQLKPGLVLFWRPDMTVFSRQLDAWEEGFYRMFQATDNLERAVTCFTPPATEEEGHPLTLEQYFAQLIEAGMLIVGDEYDE